MIITKQWVLLPFQHSFIYLDPLYEANQLKAFASMYEKGYIYRGMKPVYWSPSSLTALAESELEYVDNHSSFSIYVSFPISSLSPSASTLSKYLNSSGGLFSLIWTTTPWTIPANIVYFFYLLILKGNQR